MNMIFQSVRTNASKHPVDYKRKCLGIKRIIKQLVFVCIHLVYFFSTYFDISAIAANGLSAEE